MQENLSEAFTDIVQSAVKDAGEVFAMERLAGDYCVTVEWRDHDLPLRICVVEDVADIYRRSSPSGRTVIAAKIYDHLRGEIESCRSIFETGAQLRGKPTHFEWKVTASHVRGASLANHS